MQSGRGGLLLLAVSLGFAARARGQFSWSEVSNPNVLQSGDVSFEAYKEPLT